MSEPEYLYAYVKCGRKAYHLGDTFGSWEQTSFDRGDYTEHHTFRKLVSVAASEDRQLAMDYATPFAHAAA